MKSQSIFKMEFLMYVPKPAPSTLFLILLYFWTSCSGQKPRPLSLYSHPSTKPSSIPLYVPSKHLTTYLLHATSQSGPPSPITWLAAVSSPLLPSLSLSPTPTPPHPQVILWSNPTKAKHDYVLPLLETLLRPPSHSKQKPVLTVSAKPYVISPCYFYPIIPLPFLLFSHTVLVPLIHRGYSCLWTFALAVPLNAKLFLFYVHMTPSFTFLQPDRLYQLYFSLEHLPSSHTV